MDGVYGLIAGAAGVGVSHPIDVVKTNYQIAVSQTGISKSVPSIPSIISSIWRNSGPRGFYAGIAPNLCTYPVFWGTYFASKRKLDDWTFQVYGISNGLMSIFPSYGAAAVSSTLANPLFVVKVRMQNMDRSDRSLSRAIGDISRQPSRMFSGLGATLVNNLKLGIQFPLYDFIRARFPIWHDGWTANISRAAGSAFAAKLLSSAIMYPTDLIRTIQRSSDKPIGMITTGRGIYRSYGIVGMYRGFVAYNAWSVTNFIVMMCTLEMLRN